MFFVTKRLFLLTAVAFLCYGTGYTQDFDEDIPNINKVEKRAKEKYLSDETRDEYRYTDDKVIAEDDTIDGNVVVVKGNLSVNGQVNGDVVVILGDVRTGQTGRIYGNVTNINGRIYQDEKSTITGNQVETRAKNLFPRTEWDDEYDVGNDDWWDWNWSRRFYGSYSTLPLGGWDDEFILRYNRVQGVFLGLGVPKKISGKNRYFSMHGFGGYGFKEKKWRYEIGVDRWLINQKDYRFEIGAKVHDLTDTKDDWLITPMENSLASFLIHEDFQDYFRRTGYEFHMSQNISIFFKGTLAYRNDDYESVKRNTNWALFGGDKDFQPNPLINEGNMRSIYGELYLDTRDNKKLPRRGWYGLVSMEMSNSDLESDFYFNQYIFELRRYQKFGGNERLDMRLKIGSSEGELPVQKWYEIGGLSTLRGFDHKEYAGDRMVLANFEYNISPKTVSANLLFLDRMRYILFFDMGKAWFVNNPEDDKWYEGFSNLTINNIKSDIGLALTSWSGEYRLSFAKRLDTNNEPIEVIFRLTKPF